MTLRLLADENVDGDVISGVLRRGAEIEFVRVQDVGLSGADDPTILEWAATHGLILLTHDRKTMTRFAGARLSNGLEMPGLFLIRRHLSIGEQIEDLAQLAGCSDMSDWSGPITWLPYFR